MAKKDPSEFQEMANESTAQYNSMRVAEEELSEVAQEILQRNPNLTPSDVAYCLKEAAKNLINYS